MPLQIITEKYNTLNSLYANAGDWVDGESSFNTVFKVGSGTSNKFTYFSEGGVYWLERQSGLWSDDGFLDGDSITISTAYIWSGNNTIAQSWSRTINYISGNKMYISASITLQPSSAVIPSGTTFPKEGVLTGMTILANKLPNSLEFYFNLTPDGTTTLNSLIDGELNRFELQDVDSMTVLDALPMTQLGNKSGGLVKDVVLTYDAAVSGGFHNFTVTYKFLQYVVVQDGFEVPLVYDAADHIAPILKVKGFAQFGNPNGIIEDTTQNLTANTGEFNENYNGAPNNYSVTSTVWTNSLGDVIEALDNSGTSTFTAVISAPNQTDPTSVYNLGLMWRPLDAEFYQNRPASLGNNLLVNAPEVDFNADGSTDATVYSGLPYIGNQSNVSSDGAQWDIQNIKFELTGANELTVSGDVIPNAALTLMMSELGDDERKSTLWISIANHNLTGFSVDRVSLTLFDDDNYDAPLIGVQIPDVATSVLYDHDLNDITNSINPNTTTEDDVLYVSDFLLLDNVAYTGVKTKITAYNSTTGAEFTLESNFFSFNNVPEIAGQFQPNFVIDRGFNLPPTTDRNHISLVRKPTLDVTGKYGVTLEYGFLNRWEYWLEQSNVDNAFFDITESLDGKNKNWQKYGDGVSDWSLRLSYFTVVAGVDDFNHQTVEVRPYEDNLNITTSRVFTVLSDSTNPTNLPENELVEVEYTLVWSTDNYADEWAEVTIEDFESGNRWVISSVHAQGNVIANPLKPISGGTKLDLVISPANTATIKCVVDTSLINVNDVSLSVRLFSTPVTVEGKKTTWGVLKSTSGDKVAVLVTKQKA
jgi:hypothetical protein